MGDRREKNREAYLGKSLIIQHVTDNKHSLLKFGLSFSFKRTEMHIELHIE
jgi:mannitol/fructose-specific phosphotransferase system IIA component